jgi:hypothetical protein
MSAREADARTRASLVKWSRLPLDRVRFLAEADQAVIGTIRRGALFLMAFWSGASLHSFRKLTQVLAGLGEELELVVADVDGSPRLYNVPENWGGVHGCGEVLWIRDGKVVAVSAGTHAPDSFEENAAVLLGGHDAEP